MKYILALILLAALTACASDPVSRRAAMLDACCEDPIPADWKDKKFAGNLRYRSITFCNVRDEALK